MTHNSIAISAVRNALAAQAAFATTGAIPRGAFTVRAQADMGEIKSLIQGVNSAFGDFKAKSNEKVDGLVAEVASIQSALDAMTVQLAGAVGGGDASGNGFATRSEDKQPVHASVGLRGSKISAYYKQRAMADAGNGIDSLDHVGIGDFARGVAGMKCSDSVKMALSVGVDTAGGYKVPNIVMPGILDAMVDQSALLTAGASILPIDTGAKSVTIAAVDELPTPAWRLELGAVAESEPTFRPVTATPRSLACVVRISRELLADASDIDRALIQAISQAFALEFDRVGLVGSGTAPEPMGLYGMPGVKKVKQVGTKFAYADMLAAYQAQLETSAPAPTAVIMAPRSLVGLAGLVDTLGQPLNAPALLDNVRRLATNGVPVNLGGSTDKSLAFVGDFSTVQFALREALTIARLSETYCKTGEIGFLCHARVDVIANYPQAVTVIEGVAS